MKMRSSTWLIAALFGAILTLALFGHARANPTEHSSISMAQQQVTMPTPLPTIAPVTLAGPTPEARVLPPVGSNAGLVVGAILLVLIIIGGVLGARLRAKH